MHFTQSSTCSQSINIYMPDLLITVQIPEISWVGMHVLLKQVHDGFSGCIWQQN
jgi:hypothetical protein